MNLNRFTFCILLFLSLSTVASAQQATKADLQAVELKLTNQINELDKRSTGLEIKVEEMEKRLTIKIEELEKRLTPQIQAIHVRIDELDKRLNISMSILIGVVLAAIAVPQVLGYLQGRREREEFHQQLQDLRAEIQHQTQDLRGEMRDLGERLERQQQVMFEKLSQQQQDIEALKSRRMVTSS
ncbi:hypothetical protein HYR99_24735 [Candidatus Poribacteria bacterium]|nr:hypothetical protein [Candidatus Poribacteria bacterium]